MSERDKELDFVWVFSSDVFGEIPAPCGREVTIGTLIGLFTRVGADVLYKTTPAVAPIHTSFPWAFVLLPVGVGGQVTSETA